MNHYDRAARALLVLRADMDRGTCGDHRSAALGALLELWASGAADTWIRVAVAELCSEPQTRSRLRVTIDECLQRATEAFVADATPTRRSTTLLPPPSGDEEREEREAARASLSSVDLAVNVLGREEVVPAYSTVPASVAWFESEELRVSSGGLRL
jgi:hypothetical protein